MADYVVVNPTEGDIGVGTNAVYDNDASQGANAALIFTARPAYDGADGHAISIAYTAHTDNNAVNAISVTVTGKAIVVRPATDSDGSTITSTAANVKTAIEADVAANSLVSVANKAANDGTGLVSTFTVQSLAGGSGGTVKKGEMRELTLTDAEVIAAFALGVGIVPESTNVNTALRRALARVLKYGKMTAL